jgi:murein DD-endopeptidase MepM/ murein hydrolase activator NlpD
MSSKGGGIAAVLGGALLLLLGVSLSQKAKASAPYVPPTQPPTTDRRRGLLASGRLSSPYGPRGPEGFHAGIDIAAPAGTEVRAALAGTVVDVSLDGQRSRYGNVVIVEHAPHVLTMYAHLQGFASGLQVGSVLQRGQVLGYVGATHAPNTGYMGPHLHFEVHLQKVTTPAGRIIVNPETPMRMDPAVWLAQQGIAITDEH